MSSPKSTRQFLHLSTHSNGSRVQPLDDTVVFVLTKTPQGIVLTTETRHGKELYMFLHTDLCRPSAPNTRTWVEHIALEGRAFGSAWAEVVTILRRHAKTLERIRESSENPWVHRYELTNT